MIKGFLRRVSRFGGDLAAEKKGSGNLKPLDGRLQGDTIRSVMFPVVLPVLLDLCPHSPESCIRKGPILAVFVDLKANSKWKIQNRRHDECDSH